MTYLIILEFLRQQNWTKQNRWFNKKSSKKKSEKQDEQLPSPMVFPN